MPQQPKVPVEVWQGLNWNRPVNEIAAEVNQTPALVWTWAKRLGKTPQRSRPGPRPRVDWSAVDWSRGDCNDVYLARRYKVTEVWVRRMRKRYAPQTIKPTNRTVSLPDDSVPHSATL